MSLDIGKSVVCLVYQRYPTAFHYCSRCNTDYTTCTYLSICAVCLPEIAEKQSQNWTSGNADVDNFILDAQRSAKAISEIIEWIPYDDFINGESLARGGFSIIYKATWKQGPWTTRVNEYEIPAYCEREGPTEVVLKELIGSQNISTRYLKEVQLYLLFIKKYKHQGPRVYGITKNHATNNFVLVMEFIHGGDLRHLLIKNPKKFTWERRISFLCKLAYQLQSLHKENFIHGDFHSGNILCNSDEDFKSISVIITDMGLAGPSDTDKKHNDNEHEALYGVIAYTAPEVLQGQPKSKASDVYAFGIIMWEISSGKPAFYEYDDMVCLKLNVCGGVRPDIVSDTPDCYIELMKRCWAHDPKDIASDISQEVRSYKVIEEFTETNSPPKNTDATSNSTANASLKPTAVLGVTTKKINLPISKPVLKLDDDDLTEENQDEKKKEEEKSMKSTNNSSQCEGGLGVGSNKRKFIKYSDTYKPGMVRVGSKWVYPEDEITDGGTWEHKKRAEEMKRTAEQAAILTQQAEVKRAHHIADFLPKEELEKFEQKVKAVKTGTPDPLHEDYAQNKLDQNNIGFKMLMKQGWQAGTGLGKTGDGVVAPVNKADSRPQGAGLGQEKPDGVAEEDDEFEIYQGKREEEEELSVVWDGYFYSRRGSCDIWTGNNPRRPYY
ncbi:8348_t:CDS:2 [Paraglomus brasilianum]|uniref:8348_t:CDS:1 n=1 Tax=Paraglomus brasilianum TaxID=144538 RepID=A0A9N8ZTH1_9GLOM|nr:8348_t:CDS:2 [Paraglomus brasilianum]